MTPTALIADPATEMGPACVGGDSAAKDEEKMCVGCSKPDSRGNRAFHKLGWDWLVGDGRSELEARLSVTLRTRRVQERMGKSLEFDALQITVCWCVLHSSKKEDRRWGRVVRLAGTKTCDSPTNCPRSRSRQFQKQEIG
jgi:hypothetical protein